MSYQLQVLADNPFSYWKLDESGPVFPDSAGSLRTADLVGTVVSHPALVAGSGNALLLNNSNKLEMDDPVFNKGYELRQFTLEAWVKPVSIAGEIAVMSHSGIYDGITITPTRIYFRTKYLTAGVCEASYEYQASKSFHVVGVHTSAKNSLYVDGRLVAETDLTEEQQIDSYAFLTSDLIAGQSADSSSIALDAPAVYSSSISSDVVSRHYAYGVDVDSSEGIAGFHDATFWNFSDEQRNIAVGRSWSFEQDWRSGVISDVVVSNDFITPAYSQTESQDVEDGFIVPVYTNTSLAGTWRDSISLGESPEVTLSGMKITWLGEGSLTVEYSLDGGTTWSPTEDAPTEPLDNTDVVDLRVSFDGGIVDDKSYVSFISVTVYIDKNFIGSRADRFASVSGDGVSSARYFEPIEYADFNGIKLLSGNITVTEDASFDGEEEAGDLDITGFDMWIKPADGNILSGTGINVSKSADIVSFTGISDLVINGEQVDDGDSVFSSDSWYHISGIFSMPGNYELTVADADANISQLSLITTSLTLNGLRQIYSAYLGRPGVTVEDASFVVISENAPAANLYAHVWGITPAG